MKVNFRVTLFIIITILCFNNIAKAQMFSVNSEQPVRLDLPANSILVGYEPTSFKYTGDDTEQNLSFSDPIYRLRAELSGFEGYLAIGYNLGDANSTNLVNAGAKIDGEFRFLGDRNYFIGVPLVLGTDYLQVSTQSDENRSDDFRQSSAMVGAGLSLGFRFANRFRIESKAVPFYGFSVTSFGATGGSRVSFTNQNRIYMDRIFDRIGLTAGFDFKTARY
ncbi:MAG: hypothetical protein WD491_00240, partial [Balneolales bacterium]